MWNSSPKPSENGRHNYMNMAHVAHMDQPRTSSFRPYHSPSDRFFDKNAVGSFSIKSKNGVLWKEEQIWTRIFQIERSDQVLERNDPKQSHCLLKTYFKMIFSKFVLKYVKSHDIYFNNEVRHISWKKGAFYFASLEGKPSSFLRLIEKMIARIEDNWYSNDN